MHPGGKIALQLGSDNMPIIDADRCKICIVMKRSMAAGFAGIENHLFYKDNTRMLFGDAKASLNALVAAVKAN